MKSFANWHSVLEYLTGSPFAINLLWESHTFAALRRTNTDLASPWCGIRITQNGFASPYIRIRLPIFGSAILSPNHTFERTRAGVRAFVEFAVLAPARAAQRKR